MDLNIDTKSIFEQGRAHCRVHSANLVKRNNPYYASDKTPKATGDSDDVWSRKVEAWDTGWNFERMVIQGRI